MTLRPGCQIERSYPLCLRNINGGLDKQGANAFSPDRFTNDDILNQTPQTGRNSENHQCQHANDHFGMNPSAALPPLSPDGRRWTVSGHPVFVGDGRGDAFLEPGTSRNRQLDNTIRKHSTIGFIYPSSLLLRPAINQVPCPELFEVETAGSSHGLSGITRTSRSTGQPEGTIYPVRELRISG